MAFGTLDDVPLPSCPPELSPHTYKLPSAVRAPTFMAPATILTIFVIPDNANGANDDRARLLDDVPRHPLVLVPKDTRVLSWSSTTVKVSPHAAMLAFATDVNVNVPMLVFGEKPH